MSNDDLTPVGDTEIRIAIEIGDNAQTTQRVKDALGELTAALAEAGDDDVSGFALQGLKSGSFLFDSRIGKPTLGSITISTDANKGGGTPYVTGGSDGKWP